MRRRQRDLGFDDDAVGAVGVCDLEDVGTGEVEDARRLFAGDDLEAEEVAEGAQAAPADGADATRATRDEAAERRHAVGGGMEAHLAADRGLGLLVELLEDDTGFGADAVPGDRDNLVEAGEVEYDAA